MSFFSISKILWPMLTPSNFLLLGLVFSMFLALFAPRKFCQIGRYCAIVFFCIFFVLSFVPVGYWAMTAWERSIEQTNLSEEKRIDGIIILGGGLNPFFAPNESHSYIQNSGDRYIAMLQLMKRFPQAKILYTGGSGELFNQQQREADILKDYIESIGLKSDRVLIENQSQNTYQNAVFSKEIVNPKIGEKWILVTSAYHMPRAKAVFDKQQWTVLPYLVDYQIPAWEQNKGFCFLCYPQNMSLIDKMTREIIGILAYRLSNKI